MKLQTIRIYLLLFAVAAGNSTGCLSRGFPSTPADCVSVTEHQTKSVRKKTEITQEQLKQVKDFLSEQTEIGRLSGAVIVSRDGVPVLNHVAGYACKGLKVANRIDTKFNLGSINKSFTAVAILQLVENGKIGIDDPIGKYLDQFPAAIANANPIKHLRI